MGTSAKLFKTTVLGVGPFCIEFPDGEIVYTRTEYKQRLFAASPEMRASLASGADQLDDWADQLDLDAATLDAMRAVATDYRALLAKIDGTA